MSSTSSPFGQNEWLVKEMYRKFRDDPSSVDASWHEFLAGYSPETAAAPVVGNGQPAARPVAAVAAPTSSPAPLAAPLPAPIITSSFKKQMR